jgi:hypothetical protein
MSKACFCKKEMRNPTRIKKIKKREYSIFFERSRWGVVLNAFMCAKLVLPAVFISV